MCRVHEKYSMYILRLSVRIHLNVHVIVILNVYLRLSVCIHLNVIVILYVYLRLSVVIHLNVIVILNVYLRYKCQHAFKCNSNCP